MANTYDQYIKNAVRKNELYLKRKYELSCYAKKSHESNIRSCLARIKFQLVKALECESILPKNIIVLLDDDIIRRVELKCDDDDIDNLDKIFNQLMHWLLNEFRKLIDARKDQLPERSKKDGFPKIYWVEAPQHINFANNSARRKMNAAIQAEAAIQENMKIMRMKKVWDTEDNHSYLASHSRFISDGIFKYWGSIDNAMEFNDGKLNEQLAREFSNKSHAKHFNQPKQNKYTGTKKSQVKYQRRAEDRNYNDEHRFKLP